MGEGLTRSVVPHGKSLYSIPNHFMKWIVQETQAIKGLPKRDVWEIGREEERGSRGEGGREAEREEGREMLWK